MFFSGIAIFPQRLDDMPVRLSVMFFSPTRYFPNGSAACPWCANEQIEYAYFHNDLFISNAQCVIDE